MSWFNKPNRYYVCGCIEEYEDSTPGYGEYEYLTTTWCDEHNSAQSELERQQEENEQRIFELENALQKAKKFRAKLDEQDIPKRVRDTEREKREKHKRLVEQREGLISRLADVKKEIEDLN